MNPEQRADRADTYSAQHSIFKLIQHFTNGRSRTFVEIFCFILVKITGGNPNIILRFQLIVTFIVFHPEKKTFVQERQVVGREYLAAVCSYINTEFSSGKYYMGVGIINATPPFHSEIKHFGNGCVVNVTIKNSERRLYAVEFYRCQIK